MSNLVNMDEFRRNRQAQKAFTRWEKLVGFRPEQAARLSDISDEGLMSLAELDNDAALALYDLVLGVRNWGPGEKFHYLESWRKMEALDAYLFLADQVRFEVMRRLGWVVGLAGESRTLLDLASHPAEIQAASQIKVPQLQPDYHRYDDLEQQYSVEPAAAVRSIIPEALNAFRRLVEKDGQG